MVSVRRATEILADLALLTAHYSEVGVPVIVLSDELRALNGARFHGPDYIDPDAEILAVLQALPLDGMGHDCLMVALAMTIDAPVFAAERGRIAALVVTALGGIPLPPLKVYEKGSDKPLPQHASIDLGFGVSLTATMKDGETSMQVAERMASRALVFAEKVKR